MKILLIILGTVIVIVSAITLLPVALALGLFIIVVAVFNGLSLLLRSTLVWLCLILILIIGIVNFLITSPMWNGASTY